MEVVGVSLSAWKPASVDLQARMGEYANHQRMSVEAAGKVAGAQEGGRLGEGWGSRFTD